MNTKKNEKKSKIKQKKSVKANTTLSIIHFLLGLFFPNSIWDKLYKSESSNNLLLDMLFFD